MTIPELYELFIHNPKVTTDSRNCPRGSIFFALKGDKFDGNQYAEKALASGCVYAVIDNPDYFIGERTILVDNVLTTLQQLAHRHRKVIGCPIIGITGTNGKTTTKELQPEQPYRRTSHLAPPDARPRNGRDRNGSQPSGRYQRVGRHSTAKLRDYHQCRACPSGRFRLIRRCDQNKG